jgi:hypothetical protein
VVDERLGRVEAHPPQQVAELPRHLERRPHGVVVEVHEDRDVHLVGVALREVAGRCDGVAAERRDQRVRDGPHAAPAPPRRLRVRRDADRPGHVRGPAVAGLHEPVVVPRGEEQDLLAARRADHGIDVAHDERPARHAAEVDGLEVREQRVVALDRHDRLLGGDTVTLVQGPDLQLVPPRLPAAVRQRPAAALPQHGDGLVDAPEDRLLLLEHLHQHARSAALVLQQLLREIEVLVAVVARPHLVDGQTEHGGVETGAHGHRAILGTGAP